MLGWMAFGLDARAQAQRAMGACIGAVVGLVAVTPAAGYVTVGQSIAVGLVASLVSHVAVHLKSRTALDDTLDVFPCHGLGGVVGMVLTGVLAKDVGLIHGQTRTFLLHLLALVLVSAFCFVGSWLLYKLVDVLVPLRVSAEQEEEGSTSASTERRSGRLAPRPQTWPACWRPPKKPWGAWPAWPD